MTARGWWMRLRQSAYGDVPFVLLGLFIGWNCDVSCVVKGNSMLPTVRPGEYLFFIPYSLLTLKRYLGFTLVRPGDVVVLKVNPDLSVCKRVVKATPSLEVAQEWGREHFEEVDPSYYVVTEPLHRDDMDWYSALSHSTRSRDWDTCAERVPRPSTWLWLEGDNKEESFDSRRCGAVPAECLRGRVVGVVWPVPRLIGSKSPIL